MLDVQIYGSAALRAKAMPIMAMTPELRTLASEMLACMYAAKGVGLAAEQVGRDVAMCVIDLPKEEDCGVAMPLVLCNPRIDESEGEQLGQEGCLSFPGIYVNITRAERVRVSYMDIDGERRTIDATGLLSRAIQHELDHLNGVLLVDRMGPVQKVANAGRLKRLKRGILPAA